MVSRRQKQEMMDYLVAKLEGESEVKPRRRELLAGSGIETGYILIGANQAIALLVDQHYPLNSLQRVYRGLKAQIPNVAPVFFKDGKTFFRSAAAGVDNTGIKSKVFKTDNDHSLKNYRGLTSQIISMRPEELFVSRELGRSLQYYQPASERLEQGLVSCRFEPVELDYSHIPSHERFGPVTRDSERLSIWTKKTENNKPLVLNQNSYLVPRAEVDEVK